VRARLLLFALFVAAVLYLAHLLPWQNLVGRWSGF
jgi:hypothetical protein